jgi:aspartate aminotransferase
MAVANRVRELAAQGRDVVGLQTGDPDFVTPAHIIEAGHAALLAGDTHYPPARGTKPLLEAIAAKLERENAVKVAPTQIIATPGGKWAIYLALAALLEPGDEVILPEPAWVSYRPMIASFGGVTAGVVTHSSEGYVITADALRAALTARTKAILVNSPSNPHGHVFSRAEFDTIVEFVVANDLWLISDEIYERITFDGREHLSFAADPRVKGRTLLVNGFSKTYAMTGWRLGYLAAPPAVIDLALRLQSQAVTSASTVAMAAGVAALNGSQDVVAEMVAAYDERRRFFVPALRAMGLACPDVEGAFYVFTPIPAGYPGGSDAFARELLDEAGVATVPGGAFGPPGEGHVRATLATSMRDLERAVERIDAFVRQRMGAPA